VNPWTAVTVVAERGGGYRRGGSGPLSIAMLGTRGVPARYGGFETCIQEVGRRLVDRGHRVVVYCRASGTSTDDPPGSVYLGMELVHRPALRRRSLETLSHTGLSVAHLLRHRTDVALVFNAANAPFLPFVRAARIPVATHVDGLEWKRAKWDGLGQHYYRAVERLSVRWSDSLIADAPGISAHYRRSFGADTVQIAYGAPITDGSTDRLQEVGLKADAYHLVVARFEPENHVELIVQGFARSSATLPLVVVGAAPYADAYTAAVRAAADGRVRFLGAVWDQDLLDQLYAGARTYLHGHSVGGTNPSLLRAMGAGASVAAYDVVFNRDVLQAAGVYFSDADGVMNRVQEAEADVATCRARGESARMRAQDYDWDEVADGYESLCRQLTGATAMVGDRT
jgi:glycosyltransferase involved in cell wall biosynthesis